MEPASSEHQRELTVDICPETLRAPELPLGPPSKSVSAYVDFTALFVVFNGVFCGLFLPFLSLFKVNRFFKNGLFLTGFRVGTMILGLIGFAFLIMVQMRMITEIELKNKGGNPRGVVPSIWNQYRGA